MGRETDDIKLKEIYRLDNGEEKSSEIGKLEIECSQSEADRKEGWKTITKKDKNFSALCDLTYI